MPDGRTVLVTGTDTDVGKTVASAWLAAQLAPERWVALVKPVQTGTTRPREDGDEAFFRRALREAGNVSIETIVSLPEPLAPSIAARRAQSPIDVAALLARCRKIAEQHDLTLFEGAGGLLVTLDDTLNYADFARAVKADLVVVARPALGTLNHTLLTLEAAERRRLGVACLIVSDYAEDPDVVEQENLRFLRRVLPELPIIVLSHAPLDGDDPLATIKAWQLCTPSPPWGLRLSRCRLD